MVKNGISSNYQDIIMSMADEGYSEQGKGFVISKGHQLQQTTGREELSEGEIILVRKQIIDNLFEENERILLEIYNKKRDVSVIQAGIQKLKQKQIYKKQLERKQGELQSQFRDLEQMQTRLSREIKFLVQQEQIKRGRAIIEYNRTREVKEEQQIQKKKKDILERHLEQISRNSQVLRKKLSSIKDDINNKAICKEQPSQEVLEKEVYKLSAELEQLNNNLAKMTAQKQKSVPFQEFYAAQGELLKFKKQYKRYEQLKRVNGKLHEERQILQQRTGLLQNGDDEYSTEKNMLLQELKQKYMSLQSQKKQYQSILQERQLYLANLTNQHPELSQAKKRMRKRKACKSKQKQETEECQMQANKQNVHQQIDVRRFKWRVNGKMARLFWKISIILLVVGLFLSSLGSLFLS